MSVFFQLSSNLTVNVLSFPTVDQAHQLHFSTVQMVWPQSQSPCWKSERRSWCTQYNSVRHITNLSNFVYLGCSVCHFFSNLSSSLRLCDIRVSSVKSPGWLAIDMCQTMVKQSVVSNGLYLDTKQTHHLLFLQRFDQ